MVLGDWTHITKCYIGQSSPISIKLRKPKKIEILCTQLRKVPQTQKN